MTQMILKAECYDDLMPFEIMAKRCGILVEFANQEKTTLQKYRESVIETQFAGKRAGLTPEIIDDFIKEHRREKRLRECV